jgi:serine/threonine protein kinase
VTLFSTGGPDGQVLAGRYEIGAVLGRGGMAEVRAEWDLRLGRAVAIKTLFGESDLHEHRDDPDRRQQGQGEGEALTPVHRSRR